MATFLHSGDLGDAIYALPSVRALGGGTIYFASRPWTRTRWGPSLLSLIALLIDESGYGQAELHDGEWIDHDFSTYRHGGYRLGDTIIERQRRWVGADISLDPWLNAEPDRVSPIVINRASRWHGFDFPWRQVVETFHDEIVFIGLPEEHFAFQKEFGKVFFVPCEDLAQAAQIIAGADLYIGNQSACNAIANALGKRSVLEVCPYAPDCFVDRNRSFFSLNGEVDIEADGKRLVLPQRQGRFGTSVGERGFFHDDRDKLKVIARAAHALAGTFILYDDVVLF